MKAAIQLVLWSVALVGGLPWLICWAYGVCAPVFWPSERIAIEAWKRVNSGLTGSGFPEKLTMPVEHNRH